MHSMPLNGEDYLARHIEQVWLVEDLLPVGGSFQIYADPKVGKSYAVLQMCVAISSGQPDWLGFPIRVHGPTLYIQLDTPPVLWQERYIRRAKEIHGWDLRNAYTADKLIAPYPFDLLDARTGATEWLSEICHVIKPIFVAVDTTRKAHSGDEDSSTVMRNVITRLQDAVHGAALGHVVHERKATPEGYKQNPLMKGARGSNFLAGDTDATLHLTKKGNEGGTLRYESRACAEQKIVLKRLPSGFWSLDDSNIIGHLNEVIAKGGSLREMARELSTRTGLSEEAARHRLRRLMDKGGL